MLLGRSSSNAEQTARTLNEALERSGDEVLAITRFQLAAWVRSYILHHLWRDPTIADLRGRVQFETFGLRAVTTLVALARIEALQGFGRGFTPRIVDAVTNAILEPYVAEASRESPTKSVVGTTFIDEDISHAYGSYDFVWFNVETQRTIALWLKRRIQFDLAEFTEASRKGRDDLAVVACELLTGGYADLAVVATFVQTHRQQLALTLQRLRIGRNRRSDSGLIKST
jgi:hypothetical protein